MGQGRAYYYGAVFTAEAAGALIAELGLVAPVGDWLELPPPVELCIRENAATGERLIFLLNYSDEAQSIHLRREATDVLTGRRLQGAVELAPFDVYVLAETTEA